MIESSWREPPTVCSYYSDLSMDGQPGIFRRPTWVSFWRGHNGRLVNPPALRAFRPGPPVRAWPCWRVDQARSVFFWSSAAFGSVLLPASCHDLF